jgi:PEP-CTERM putative exosortase interaction domain
VIEWSLANTAIGNLISGGSSVNLMLVGPLTFNGSTYHFVTPVMDVFGGAPNTPISLSVPIAQTHTFSVSETDINYNSAYLDAVMGDEPITLGFGSAVSFSVGGLATFDAVTLGSVTLTYHYTAVPEPSTYAAIFGVLALAAAAWFRRRAAL